MANAITEHLLANSFVEVGFGEDFTHYRSTKHKAINVYVGALHWEVFNFDLCPSDAPQYAEARGTELPHLTRVLQDCGAV